MRGRADLQVHSVGLFTPGAGRAGTDRQFFFINGQACAPDLFVVDQHAADEKFNFETLQAKTRLESQLCSRESFCSYFA